MSPVRISPDQTSGIVYVNSECGRCGGSGQIAGWDSTINQPIAIWCPICKGTGEAQYFQGSGASHSALPTNRRYADGAGRK